MIYTKNKLKEIVFPLGGIGSGTIGLAGNGALVDWEIFNRPNKGSLNDYSFFAVKAEFSDGRSITKILQGDHIKDFMGQYANSESFFNGYGFGPANNTMCGFPHFKNVKFDGKFPIATLTFSDDKFPAKVIMKAFNPFIPLDSDNSSIPAAFFDIKIKSLCDNVKYSIILSVANPFESSYNKRLTSDKYTAVKMLNYSRSENEKEYGDITIAIDHKDGICQEYWYRGSWQDKITTFWRELTDGTLGDRHYEDASLSDVSSVGANVVLSRNQSKAFHFVISWNIPNNYAYWKHHTDENGKDITWKNYYATLFKDSADSSFYSLNNFNTLYKKTAKFCNSLHGCTLDKSVIDAASATLSVLKSPTVLRLEDGTFYGWEGVKEKSGSCEGTCNHVWSYAYALCFLFPELERSLRNTEIKYDTDEFGRMYFRTTIPLGSGQIDQPPCVDGQMATIIKIYRDWKITGDSEWLKNNWNDIKKILEYAWNEHNSYEWDRNKDGVLEGRQHHTLDLELFGPSSWLEGMYLCALKAAAEMAEFLGDTQKKNEYTALFENGYKYTKENLFNGNYFFHKIDITNKEYTEHFSCPDYWNEEKGQLKYQISEGSIIDQMLGQWHANINGLGDIFDKDQRKTALKSMYKNNFKRSFRDFANMWRIFALNDESGAIMCDYPKGANKPIIPVLYCEECMTGFEYSFAGLLISEGFIEEGLNVVRAVRNRYNGENRNPFNEIECGSNYARSMASFALLPIFCGFEFDVPKKHIGFSPILSGNFKCMWSLGCAWGNFIKTDNKTEIIIADGSLELCSLSLENTIVKSICVDGKNIDFKQKGNCIIFENCKINKSILVKS